MRHVYVRFAHRSDRNDKAFWFAATSPLVLETMLYGNEALLKSTLLAGCSALSSVMPQASVAVVAKPAIRSRGLVGQSQFVVPN